MKRPERWLKYWVRFWLGVIVTATFALLARAEIATPAVPLSIDSAIQRAIQTQLVTQLAGAASMEARGRAIQAAASLLPQITGSVAQSRVFKTNLEAVGFNASPFLPNPVIGPYNVFDARFQLVQKLLDLNSMWNARAASASAQASRLAEDLAAEQVASAATLAFIEDVRTLQAVRDAQANWDLAQRLATLAHHQHDAGLATAVDVARAETRVAQDHQIFIQNQLAATQADIRLKRVVGLPLGEVVAIAEPPIQAPTAGPEGVSALAQAQTDRMEVRITVEQVKAETFALDAAHANHLPTLSAAADYGFSGNTPDSTARTGSIGGRLDLPIFSGGQTHGQSVEAKGRLAAARNQEADTRIQVEEDVRLALKTLSAEIDEIQTADTQLSLAERELQLTEDRYRAGVGDNIQVITAQAALEDARKSRVDARARYADAQANLAMAVGHMRTFRL